jgi:uncharacterized protein
MLDPLIGSALAVYGGVVGGLYAFQRRLLYRPHATRPALGDLAALGVCEVDLATADGLTLFSWFLPPQAARPVILYLHGNGGHIGYRAERLRRFAQEGYGVLLVEYRGYGGNPGRPCERGLFLDGEAAFDFVSATGIEPRHIVLWGESLGSGVAVYLAAAHKTGALILEAPFTNVAACAQRHYPFVPAALLLRDRFDSLSRIRRITAPLLILHGERDMVVPVRHGRALLAAATGPKEGWFSRSASHETLAQFGALEVAVAFIERRIGQSAAAPVAAAADFDLPGYRSRC